MTGRTSIRPPTPGRTCQSDAYYNEQTYYVTAGETASLIARYRQTHSFSDVKLYTAQGYVSGGSDNPTTAATGLVLDGPDFVLSGSEPGAADW